MKELLRPDEVAKILRISRKKVYELINDNENPMPCKKIGGQFRIRQKDLDRYLKICVNKVDP